jgi:hypothetical protein
MDALLKEFQKFWRRNPEIWEQQSDYTEVFPHLLLMGFLQRVTNGDGHIARETAAGSGRMDISVEYHGSTYILEIKLLKDHDGHETVKEEGLEQITRYRDRIDGKASCWLIIFDRRTSAKGKAWDKKLTWNVKQTAQGDVTIVGC